MHEFGHARQAIEAMIRSGDLTGLLRQAEALHGHLCPGLALGVKAGQYAMKFLDRQHHGMEDVIAIVECNNCFTDGVQVVTGCTFGNNALIFKDLGKTAVTVARRDDRTAVRLVVHPNFRERMFARYPAAGPLFEKVVVKREFSHEDEHRFQHLWAAMSRRELETPLEEQMSIQTLTLSLPEYARMHPTMTCDRCGEGFMAPRAVGQGDQTFCLACARSDYFMLTGQGINVIKEGD